MGIKPHYSIFTGKLADLLSTEMDVCARCAGGNNAGHTIVVNMGPDKVKTKFDFHMLPSGECFSKYFANR